MLWAAFGGVHGAVPQGVHAPRAGLRTLEWLRVNGAR
jgi:hypothetical protein